MTRRRRKHRQPGPPRIEIEGILRLFFADHGDIDDANASILATATHARDALDFMIEDYVATGGQFPERMYPIAAVCDLITDVLERIEAHARQVWPVDGNSVSKTSRSSSACTCR